MKKRISWVLAFALALSLFTGTSLTASALSFSDMPTEGYWSFDALNDAVNNGLLNGYEDGTIRPKSNITRAEAAAMINRAFGAVDKESISFSDVTTDKWYYADVQKAIHMKAFYGIDANTFSGDAYITREQAFTVISRAIGLTNGSDNDLASFPDASKVSAWAVGSMAGMVKAGYVIGDYGYLKPNAFISREEFAKVMSNVVSKYITAAGIYSSVPAGNILVRGGGITLKNATVNGDLIIGDGVGKGDVTLENVTVTGRIVLRGAGANSFRVTGTSSAANIIVTKATEGGIHIDVSDESEVNVVYVNDGSDDVIVEGTVGTVSIAAEGAAVSLRNASVSNVEMTAANASVVVESGNVGSVTVAANASAATVKVAASAEADAEPASIGNIITAAANTSIIVESGSVSAIVAQDASSGTTLQTSNDAKVGIVAVASEADVNITNETAGAIGTVVAEDGADVSAAMAAGGVDTSVKTLAGTITEDASSGAITVESDDGSINTTILPGTPETEPVDEGGSSGGFSGGGESLPYNNIKSIVSGVVEVSSLAGGNSGNYQAVAAAISGLNYAVLLDNGYILLQYDQSSGAVPFGVSSFYFNFDASHQGSVTTDLTGYNTAAVNSDYTTWCSDDAAFFANLKTISVNFGGTSLSYTVNPSSDPIFTSRDGFVFLKPDSDTAVNAIKNMLMTALTYSSGAGADTIKTIAASDPSLNGELTANMVEYFTENYVKSIVNAVKDGTPVPAPLTVFRSGTEFDTEFQFSGYHVSLSQDYRISVSYDSDTDVIEVAILAAP